MISSWGYARLLNRLLFNRSLAYILMTLFTALTIIFTTLILLHTFEKRYFDTLKSIFPHFYIHLDKKEPQLSLDIVKSKEIFETDWGDFEIKLSPTQKLIKLNNIAIRSFNQAFPPQIISQIKEKTNKNVFITPKLQELLIQKPSYKGQLYIQKNDLLLKFNTVILDVDLDANWLLFSNKNAKKLFALSDFDKLVFYSNKLDEKEMYRDLKHEIKQPLHMWSEHISLKNRALKEIMSVLFSIVFLAISLINMAALWQISQSILDDIRILTRHSVLYGVSKHTLFQVYTLSTFLILSSLLILSFLLAWFLDEKIIDYLWQTEVILPSIAFMAVAVFSLVALFLLYYVYKVDHLQIRKGNCGA